MSKEANVNESPDEQKQKPAFRGVAIPIDEQGNIKRIQLQGINQIEAYGALKLILDNLEKKLQPK